MDWKTMARRVGVGVGVFAIFFILLAMSARREAMRHFKTAVAAEVENHREKAIAHYDRAIRSHYPFSAVRPQAADRLWELAKTYEGDGHATQARETYQTLLSALCAVETGFSDQRDRIPILEEKIEDLLPPRPRRRNARKNPTPSPSPLSTAE